MVKLQHKLPHTKVRVHDALHRSDGDSDMEETLKPYCSVGEPGVVLTPEQENGWYLD